MAKKDYYATLGVSKDATDEEIRKVYRQLARKYHPDLNKARDAEDHFKRIGEAYAVLNDPKSRAAYDKYGDMWKHADEIEAAAQRQQGSPFSSEGPERDVGDLFGELFRSRRGRRARPRDFREMDGFEIPGTDQHVTISISLEEAYRGATRTLRLSIPQQGFGGPSESDAKELKVRIPAGVTEGQTLRLSGKGGPGFGGGPNGDLYLEIKLEPHRIFEIHGRDVYLSLPIAPWEAALGAKIDVPTLKGSVEMKIPAGAQGGSKLRLKAKGLPGDPPGDQFIVLKIVTPKPQTPDQRAFYQKMAEEFPFNARSELEQSSVE